MIKTYTIYTAKPQLYQQIKQACAGEEIVSSKRKNPAIKMLPMDKVLNNRQFGAMRGKAVIEELPNAELTAWEQ